jgi:heme/copper-type cytochrome/quinol oxidase subunit 2
MPIVVEAVSKEDFAKWVQTHQKNNTLTMNSQEQTIKQAKAAVFANALPTSGVKAS